MIKLECSRILNRKALTHSFAYSVDLSKERGPGLHAPDGAKFSSLIVVLDWHAVFRFYVSAKAMVMGDPLRSMQDSIYRPSTCRAVVAVA
jgi:hypothetical protein